MAGTDQRYQIIERLDAGGMAEVFKAKAVSMRGFEKIVAIKRVLPNLTKDERFVQMFLDEARLSLHLQHANVVQTFDIGQADGTYFIVMEFVEGANLKKILNWLDKRGQRFSIEEACFVAIEMCKGLTHAHEKRDADGDPLEIVHRDVSPPNVLISREGEVKIMDFGLAKATLQVESTDPGVVKGKFGYLSPEAAHGEVVDVQTDVFAVGIVLWEMLAGRRLFLGKTDLDTLKQVRACNIPDLRQYSPNVPTELLQIIQRSLARAKSDRHQTAQDLSTDLTQFLFNRGRTVTNYDLSRIVSSLVDEGARRKGKVRSDAIDQLIQDEINKFISVPTPAEPVGGAGEGSGLDLSDADAWGDAFEDIGGFDLELDAMPSGGSMALPAISEQMAARDAAAAQPASGGGAGSPAAAPSTANSNPGFADRFDPNPPVRTAPPALDPPAPNPGTDSGSEGGGGKGLWVVLGVVLLLVVVALGVLAYFATQTSPAEADAEPEPSEQTWLMSWDHHA